MSLFTGIAFLVYWLLQEVFTLDSLKAALTTAIVFILIGLLLEAPAIRSRWGI